jgi:hypothetical protein
MGEVREFFVTSMEGVEKNHEFVRLVFHQADRQTITIMLTPSAFTAMAWLVAACPDVTLH